METFLLLVELCCFYVNRFMLWMRLGVASVSTTILTLSDREKKEKGFKKRVLVE